MDLLYEEVGVELKYFNNKLVFVKSINKKKMQKK